ncbi:type II secretion system protein [Aliiglaciecola sp. CAU 1673]|uniref:PilW family protein n=1 Tax=Aliiglaciecola sp. CAU 1673 TaxID=3032595 RepID=UPI0023D9D50D|nr:type II secretion system protein [Aliiglaciecola sp. CAU 1673]MDF2179131.1 type II secretion system protein [Aliiglaciecola sp. CAU 1673]
MKSVKPAFYHSPPSNGIAAGFTLIELVAVMVILGIVSLGIFGFISMGAKIYSDASERDQLLSEARFVLERLNRELRNAVPNSVRVTSDGRCLEFLPNQWTTFYKDVPVSPEVATSQIQVVELKDIDGNSYNVVSGDQVLVYPVSASALYANSNNQVRKTLTGSSGTDMITLQLANATTFAADSPASRLYIAKQPVSYCVSSGDIYRHSGYGYIETQSNNPANPVLMGRHLVNDVNDINDRPFNFQPGTLSRSAAVYLRLRFNLNDEKVVFSSEVHLPNAP